MKTENEPTEADKALADQILTGEVHEGGAAQLIANHVAAQTQEQQAFTFRQVMDKVTPEVKGLQQQLATLRNELRNMKTSRDWLILANEEWVKINNKQVEQLATLRAKADGLAVALTAYKHAWAAEEHADRAIIPADAPNGELQALFKDADRLLEKAKALGSAALSAYREGK